MTSMPPEQDATAEGLTAAAARSPSKSSHEATPSTGRQRTIAASTIVRGKGLLFGVDAEVEFVPAPPGSGIAFERIDLTPPVLLPALIDHAVSRPRRSTLRVGDASIDTVEHCLSALVGLGIGALSCPAVTALRCRSSSRCDRLAPWSRMRHGKCIASPNRSCSRKRTR